MNQLPKETEEKIYQLQLLEQNVQSIASQRQQFQSQLIELESAISELSKTDDAYKIIGNIMVHTNKETLTIKLNEQKEVAQLRIKSFEKQEKELREKANTIQTSVMGLLKK